jgi:murein DD-endopeptidase MepM/ murein hydrolase activator NlpD
MFRKKLTLMLIPNSQGVSRQISVSKAWLYLCAVAVVLITVAAVFFSAQFFTDKVAEKELNQLRAENQRLKAKFEQMRWTLAEVESRYDVLTEKEGYIRSLFNLPEVNASQRRLGVGGPQPPRLATMDETELIAYDTERKLDHMLRLSELHLQEFTEVENEFLDIRDRLEYTPSIWPTKGWFSRGYGMQHDPFTGYKQMHRGVDIANRAGTPIVATAAGKVVKIARQDRMGKMITIDHGYGFLTRYGHLSDVKVKVGQQVKRGDPIALMGNTGRSTGPHLHYEVWRNKKALNPMDYILNEMYATTD